MKRTKQQLIQEIADIQQRLMKENDDIQQQLMKENDELDRRCIDLENELELIKPQLNLANHNNTKLINALTTVAIRGCCNHE